MNPLLVCHANELNREFVEKVNDFLDLLDRSLTEFLRGYGGRVIDAEWLTDALPELKGVKPYQWTEGSTMDSLNAVCLGKRVAIARNCFNGGATSQVRLSDIPHLLYHEIGHLYWNARHFRDNQELREAYEMDRKQIPAGEWQKLSYFLQEGTGIDETFSEMFAYLNSDDSDANPYSYQQETCWIVLPFSFRRWSGQ